ncbi:MAG TPA: PKD domain-containing protein [Bacteroidales bacterium]|nr:PKD domain-containing protein [Bacteroidales bacterium]
MSIKKYLMPNFYVIGLLSLNFIFSGFSALAQQVTKRVLFIGNSYTYVNNLPQMVADVAVSAGDTLFFDSNAIGGYTFQMHTTNATTLNKISIGNWDYVVLQEQSQLPSFPISQVEAECFPYANKLDSLINAGNPCAETVLFMTWGRKNGDASNCGFWPPVCTYNGMDSLLNQRYRMMADSNDAILSPVGAVWHYIRQNYPAIELYNSDESHPSVAGTYAAACCFYSALFRKDPALITFNSSLSVADAENIRNAVKLIVYDSLMNWHIGEYDPSASFSYAVSGAHQVTFTNSSAHADSFSWNFGDGNTAVDVNPTHTYPMDGTYTVTLVAVRCGLQDTTEQIINVTPMGVSLENQSVAGSWNVYPNPAQASLTVRKNDPACVFYKIFSPAGIEMLSGIIERVETIIDINKIPGGLYIIQLFNEKNESRGYRKIVKVDR